MKTISVIFFVFLFNSLYSQNYSAGNIEIKDSVVIKKKKQDVIRLNIKISCVDCKSHKCYFYNFHKMVPSIPFVNSSELLNKYRDSSVGLNYIIEDYKGNIVLAKENLYPSYVDFKDEITSTLKNPLIDTNKLKLVHRIKNANVARNSILSKLILDREEKSLIVYPLLKIYHDLSRGEYFLYLFYSFNSAVEMSPPTFGIWDANKPCDKNIFRGTISSNKIKLIVE